MSAIISLKELQVLIRDIASKLKAINTENSNFNNSVDSISSQLLLDLELMFRYTFDGNTWNHATNLDENPFPTFLSTDTVATEYISGFVYERAEFYFSQQFIKSDMLDWFYLDFVVAVNYRYQCKVLSDNDFKNSYPILFEAIEKFDGEYYLPLVF